MAIHITKITGNAGSGKSTALRALADAATGSDLIVRFVSTPRIRSVKREINRQGCVTVLIDDCSPKLARKLAKLDHSGTVHFYLAMQA